MQAFIANMRRFLGAMVRQARELRLQQTASSLTLLTLLAIVPMAALGLLVLSALPAFEAMRGDLEKYLETHLFLPSFSNAVVRSINGFLGAADRLSALGTAVFLATGLSAMLTIDSTLNRIWNTLRPRPLWQRLMLYWTLLTLGPVLLAAAITLQFKVQASLSGAPTMTATLAAVLPVLLGIAALALLYRLAPNEPVRWVHALAGAILGMLLLNVLGRLLAVYITRFPTYTLVYGAFAALPLFLIWLFSVWMSVLIGALLAANLRYWGLRSPGHAYRRPAERFDRAVQVLTDVVRSGDTPLPCAGLRSRFGGDAQAADLIASLLVDQGYLVRVWPSGGASGPMGVWDEYWLGAPGLSDRTLRPLFEHLWQGQSSKRRARGVPGPWDTQTGVQIDAGGDQLDRPIGELLGVRCLAVPVRS